MGNSSTQSLIARLKAAGQAQFGSAMKTAAAQVRGLGTAATEATAKSQALGRSLRDTGAGLVGFAGRAKWAGAAVLAALGGIAYVGLKFNSTMEQNTVAFTHFLGSAQAASQYIGQLYRLAATTPFEFAPLVTADKRMLAFGFSAKGALSTLKVIGDAVSGLGSGQEGIDRMVIAFGQIKAAGVLRGQDLLQLQQAGIATTKYLKEAGLITKKDVGQVGNLHISAQKGIAAIIAGMRRDFGGLSREQGKTFAGQLSTLRDNAKQIAGYATEPLFGALENGLLPALNRSVERMQKFAKGGGFRRLTAGFMDGLSGKVKPGPVDKPYKGIKVPGLKRRVGADPLAGMFGKGVNIGAKIHSVVATVKGGVKATLAALAPAKPFLDNVLVPLVGGFAKGLWMGIKGLLPLVKLLAQGLGLVGGVLRPFRGLIGGVGYVLGFLATGPLLKVVGGMAKAWAASSKLLAPFRALWGLFRGGFSVLGRIDKLFGGFGHTIASAARGGLGDLRAFFELYGEAVIKAVGRGIMKAPGLLLNAIKWAFRKAMGGLGKLGGVGKAALGFLGFKASGGAVGQSGPYVVGERGPEVVNLRAGDDVTPNARLNAQMPRLRGDRALLRVEIPVNIAGRNVDRVMAQLTVDGMAAA